VVLLTLLLGIIILLVLSFAIAVSQYVEGESILNFAETEWWYYFGGAIAIVSIYSFFHFIEYITVSGVTVCLTAGQLFMSLLMDNYGVLDFEVKPASTLRVTGVCLVCFAAIGMQLAKREVAIAQSKNTLTFESIPDEESQLLLHHANTTSSKV
jgi:uncharacterized membrane protein YdcZ (DUF606 family)